MRLACCGGIGATANRADALADLDFNGNTAKNFRTKSEQTVYYEAQVMGLADAYVEDVSPNERGRLRGMLKENRYYLSLMVYDHQWMMNGELKLLWTTRCSIRAAGQSFSAAIRRMRYAASDFFGKNIKGVKLVRVTAD